MSAESVVVFFQTRLTWVVIGGSSGIPTRSGVERSKNSNMNPTEVLFGANLNPERKFPSMFEPIHGSAPDIAGQQIANPLATVWSASQMLEFFGHKQWADRLIRVIEEILVEKKVLTPDLGGTAKTSEVGDEVIKKLRGE